jgi:hypothetical protein
MSTRLNVIAATALIGIGTLSLSPPANAGWGCGWGCGWGPALAGFGVGALVGNALAAPPFYVVPPPPPDYYGPAVYGPPNYYEPPDYDEPTGPPPRAPSWYGNRPYPRSKAPAHAADGQRPGPLRSATGKTGILTAAVEPKVDVKFKAAQAKAKRDGVQNLTQRDIEGLTREQIKQLRGY